MSEIDQQFIEFVVKSLVGKPDSVKVERRIDEKGVLLELTVDPDDLGRVIGKRGATAQSLRTLLRALGTKNDARYNLKIIDNGVGAPPKSDSSERPSESSPNGDKPEPAAQNNNDQEVQSVEPSKVEELAEADIEPEAEATEDTTSDRLRQTREELADLDDLDV